MADLVVESAPLQPPPPAEYQRVVGPPGIVDHPEIRSLASVKRAQQAGADMEEAIRLGRTPAELRSALEQGGFNNETPPLMGIDQYRVTTGIRAIQGNYPQARDIYEQTGRNYQFDPSSPKAIDDAIAIITNVVPTNNGKENPDIAAARGKILHQLTNLYPELKGRNLREEDIRGALRRVYETPLQTGRAVTEEYRILQDDIKQATGVDITIGNCLTYWKNIPPHLQHLYTDAIRRFYELPADAASIEDVVKAAEDKRKAAAQAARTPPAIGNTQPGIQQAAVPVEMNQPQVENQTQQTVQENQRRIQLAEELFDPAHREATLKLLPSVIQLDPNILNRIDPLRTDLIQQTAEVRFTLPTGEQRTMKLLSANGGEAVVFETEITTLDGRSLPVVLKIRKPGHDIWGSNYSKEADKQVPINRKRAQANADGLNRLHKLIRMSPIGPYFPPQLSSTANVYGFEGTITVQPKLEGENGGDLGYDSGTDPDYTRQVNNIQSLWKKFMMENPAQFLRLFKTVENHNFAEVRRLVGKESFYMRELDLSGGNWIINRDNQGRVLSRSIIDY